MSRERLAGYIPLDDAGAVIVAADKGFRSIPATSRRIWRRGTPSAEQGLPIFCAAQHVRVLKTR
jgi:hypothetical protein